MIEMAQRFRGFMPVVVDVETGGFNEATDALLQIAAVLIDIDKKGEFFCSETVSCHVNPFEGANLEPKSMQINGIDVDHPLRDNLTEGRDASGFILVSMRPNPSDLDAHISSGGTAIAFDGEAKPPAFSVIRGDLSQTQIPCPDFNGSDGDAGIRAFAFAIASTVAIEIFEEIIQLE